MIRYDLTCEAGHGFESWFRSSGDYDAQRKRKLVECPVCGSHKVEKQIMAPRLKRTDKAPRVKSGEEKAPVAMMSPEEAEFRQKLRELKDHVTKNAENVGEKFPELARKMHNEEIERRSIYGEASPDEVKSLLDDEVDIHPLPILPDDRN
ncbi:MAG: DUF1178 family protein [Xanthobacteraceae bacterium]|nr:DUF1178 family protein [Xanthobacteraceae bacterium]MCW5677932.1 DUF1178 family protein [Xanthobacteraceae bacterium]